MVAKLNSKIFLFAILTLLNLTYAIWSLVKHMPSSAIKFNPLHPAEVVSYDASRSRPVVRTTATALNQRTYPVWRYTNISQFDSVNITFLLERSYACREPPFLVVIVCSAVENFDLRNAIRQTWGSLTEPDVRILFLVGRHSNSSIDSLVYFEDEQNGDMIQADFIDSYTNLTLKSTTMLRWMKTYCSAVRFLLKTDDDTFINTPLLLRDLRNTVHRRFIMGNVIALAKPVREPQAKWFTPTDAFRRSSYPNYVSGAAYVISGDAIADLCRASTSVPMFWIEDVYITGLLATTTKIQHIFNGKFDGFKEFADMCSTRFHTVRHRISTDQMRILWSIVQGEDHSRCLENHIRSALVIGQVLT